MACTKISPVARAGRFAWSIVVAACLAGCTGARGQDAPVTNARSNTWTTPHVLTIADGGDVTTLNPHLSQFASTANLSELTMAWLIRWDEHNQPYPELATEVPTKANGGISNDGRTVTYHLRKGIRWSDGAPFDADDVVFSTSAVNNPANNEGARFDQIAKVDEPDKYTVIYHLKAPYSLATEAFFSSCCANPSLLPKHLLARYPNINNVPYNALPVGIGPFKFARWDRGKQVVMVANPLYWRGRPKLDKIVYEVVPTTDGLLAGLAAHRVDLWYQFSGAYLARVQALPGVAVLKQPSYAYNHFDFNLTHPIVADRAVREALRYALDRPALVDKVEHGVGTVQDSALPVSAPYYSDLGTARYDPQRANALLDRAGWTRGAGGIRVKNGVPLQLNVAVRAGSADTDAQLALLREDWRRVGAGITVRHYPGAQMFAPVKQGGVIYGTDWDVVSFAWAADPMGDFSGTYGCHAFPPAGGNNVRWCNPTAQKAMDALLVHYEQAQRTADVRVAMRQFVDDVPSIVSFLRTDMFGYNRDLKNYQPNSMTPFDNMMKVDI
jgi:peptide/nickel transport system substrate-binding protein